MEADPTCEKTSVITYCRLCAEETPEEDLIPHDSDEALSVDVVEKCALISIDISTNNGLPRSICYCCMDMLRRTYLFITKTRIAQEKLKVIFFQNLSTDVKEDIAEDIEFPLKQEEYEAIKEEVSPEQLIQVKEEPYDEVMTPLVNMDTDSDQPLLRQITKKKKKRKKKKNSVQIKEELSPLELLDQADDNMFGKYEHITWMDLDWGCVKCEALFKDLTSLRKHSIEIHASCCIFMCPTCGGKFTQFYPLLKHVRRHHESLLCCCEHCNESFSGVLELRRHRLLSHNEQFACKKCGIAFESNQLLDKHVEEFSRRKNKDGLKCSVCDRDFKSKSNLQSHIKTSHEFRKRNFTCHICGKLFYTNGTLMAHMLIHDEAKKYKCDFCPLAFKAKGNLIAHISLHSGVKPYICEQCGKSFRAKRHLKSHLIVHTDLMPFSCEYCGKPFRFKTRLNLHLRQHTGAKPYSCKTCMRNFTNGSNFKKHMMRRHNIDTSKRIKTIAVKPLLENDGISEVILAKSEPA